MTKMTPPEPRPEMLDKICQYASTALLSDCMDEAGYRHNVLHHRLRPLKNGVIVAGWARTVRWVDVDEVDEHPYDVEIEVIDSLRPHDVIVHAQDIALRNAPWGELMSTVAMKRGAAACICDSCIRDTRRINQLGFPVWYTAIKPLDSRGRGKVVEYDIPVVCGEVLIRAGDLIVADDDGVISIPQSLVERIVPKAIEKGTLENQTRQGLEQGRTLREMYDQYGVL